MRMRPAFVLGTLATLFSFVLTLGYSSTSLGAATRNWESIQKDIAKAEAFVVDDPVSVFLFYKELLGSQFYSSAEQRQGLQNRMAELEPMATARISDDFQRAVARGNLRDATLLGKIKGLATYHDSLVTQQDKMEVPLSLQKDRSQQLIWKVSAVVAKNVGPEYVDVIGLNRFTVTASGLNLVHVSASITNVSDEGDVPYIRWTMDPVKRVLTGFMTEWSVGVGDRGRWLDNAHIGLSVNGNAVACKYVCTDSKIPFPKGGVRINYWDGKSGSVGGGYGISEGGDLGKLFEQTRQVEQKIKMLSNRMVSAAESGNVVFAPAFIQKGKSARLNMLFAVPISVDLAELRLLGAEPISVTVGPKRN